VQPSRKGSLLDQMDKKKYYEEVANQIAVKTEAEVLWWFATHIRAKVLHLITQSKHLLNYA